MSDNIITRFAPSPTGYLHIGNIKTAFANWLFARQNSGNFILRLDDTDTARSREEYTQAIIEDLNWLGLFPDKVFKQSERLNTYNNYAKKLKDLKLLYPCFEEPEQLEKQRQEQLTKGKPPIYDRAALTLNKEEITKKINSGLSPHWRFKLPKKYIKFTDSICGPKKIHMDAYSDPILIRSDNSYSYTFTTVIDDIELNISHIYRGKDHLTNTGIQIAILNSLNADIPVYGHHGLITDLEKKPLSKRNNSMRIREIKSLNLEPETILLRAIGTNTTNIAPSELCEILNNPQKILKELSQNSDIINCQQLVNINKKMLSKMSTLQINGLLEKYSNTKISEKIWNTLKNNVTTINEVQSWNKILTTQTADAITIFDSYALNIIEKTISINLHTLKSTKDLTNIFKAIKKEGAVPPKTLMKTIRLALTGIEKGPEISNIIDTLGLSQAILRLRAPKQN